MEWNRKALILYDEACIQFSDRQRMLDNIAAGRDPHREYLDFAKHLEEDQFFLEDEYWSRYDSVSEHRKLPKEVVLFMVREVLHNLAHLIKPE